MSNEINLKALFNISYGLYVVTSNDGKRDNGLILNSVMQLSDSPASVAVSINKKAYSHDVIKRDGRMNVCTLSEDAPFSVFERFGFTSGREKDKFENFHAEKSANGLPYLSEYINGYISLKVTGYIDAGTHGLFVCSVEDARVISDRPSMTYAYYHKNVKPKPEEKPKKKGYVCTVCGYVHDEEELPDDFECPLCHHGREVFEPIE